MKDIPVFSTENGVASLGLSQIPISGAAYIRMQSALTPAALLRECVDFCKSCGAARIYAAGEGIPADYPVYTEIIRMQAVAGQPREEIPALFPLLPEHREQWRALYNRAMEHVDGASQLSHFDMKGMLRDGDCYFVHDHGELLGLGKASGGRIHALAAVKPHAGAQVLAALSSLFPGDTVTLTVASTNTRAVRLYQRAGFLHCGVETVWYQIV